MQSLLKRLREILDQMMWEHVDNYDLIVYQWQTKNKKCASSDKCFPRVNRLSTTPLESSDNQVCWFLYLIERLWKTIERLQDLQKCFWLNHTFVACLDIDGNREMFGIPFRVFGRQGLPAWNQSALWEWCRTLLYSRSSFDESVPVEPGFSELGKIPQHLLLHGRSLTKVGWQNLFLCSLSG